MQSTIHSFVLAGTEARPVEVTCRITSGIGITINGLPDTSVKETLLRTITALMACGHRIPGKKIVIGITPDVSGCATGQLDLPVALAILAASGQIQPGPENTVACAGELGLEGSIRSVRGGVQFTRRCIDNGFSKVILPKESTGSASFLYGEKIQVCGALNLPDAIEAITTDKKTDADETYTDDKGEKALESPGMMLPGRTARALEIAAAGGHDILLTTEDPLLAQKLPSLLRDLLPEPDMAETEKILAVRSACMQDEPAPAARPVAVVCPADSITEALGGGMPVSPGKVTKASGGVLHVRNLQRVPASVQECIARVHLDDSVTISRLKGKVTMDAQFQMVLTSDGTHRDTILTDMCTVRCTDRSEGTLPPVLLDVAGSRQRVLAARRMQAERYAGKGCGTNGRAQLDDLSANCPTDRSVSPGIMRVARTIADLEGAENIKTKHITEAESFTSFV